MIQQELLIGKVYCQEYDEISYMQSITPSNLFNALGIAVFEVLIRLNEINKRKPELSYHISVHRLNSLFTDKEVYTRDADYEKKQCIEKYFEVYRTIENSSSPLESILYFNDYIQNENNVKNIGKGLRIILKHYAIQENKENLINILENDIKNKTEMKNLLIFLSNQLRIILKYSQNKETGYQVFSPEKFDMYIYVYIINENRYFNGYHQDFFNFEAFDQPSVLKNIMEFHKISVIPPRVLDLKNPENIEEAERNLTVETLNYLAQTLTSQQYFDRSIAVYFSKMTQKTDPIYDYLKNVAIQCVLCCDGSAPIRYTDLVCPNRCEICQDCISNSPTCLLCNTQIKPRVN